MSDPVDTVRTVRDRDGKIGEHRTRGMSPRAPVGIGQHRGDLLDQPGQVGDLPQQPHPGVRHTPAPSADTLTRGRDCATLHLRSAFQLAEWNRRQVSLFLAGQALSLFQARARQLHAKSRLETTPTIRGRSLPDADTSAAVCSQPREMFRRPWTGGGCAASTGEAANSWLLAATQSHETGRARGRVGYPKGGGPRSASLPPLGLVQDGQVVGQQGLSPAEGRTERRAQATSRGFESRFVSTYITPWSAGPSPGRGARWVGGSSSAVPLGGLSAAERHRCPRHT